MENLELQARVKNLRAKQGLSQEELAEKAGLSLRTIQRIENGESIPRGDTLKRLSIALQSTPDDLIEWQVQEDKNVVKMLNLSQLGFLAFPLLGIVMPLAIWILKKDKIRNVDAIGKSILNFQITWAIALFILYLFIIIIFMGLGVFINPIFYMLLIGVLYAYNLVIIILNTFLGNKMKTIKYIPAIKFLD